MDFIIEGLTPDFVKSNIQDFIKIANDNIVDEYWQENNFLSPLEKKWIYSFVVINNEKIAGFLIASEKDRSVHIHKFVVDAPFQKMGLGTLMMNHLFKMVSHRPITLKVQEKNQNAFSFYLRKGFVITGIQNNLHTMSYQP